MNKVEKFASVRSMILGLGFKITGEDSNRPWGGYFVIHEDQAQKFTDRFFPGTQASGGLVSPKFLLVEPGKKLSWQYHHRRSEKWKVIEGPVGITQSPSDLETAMKIFMEGEEVIIAKGERHRLSGLSSWGLVAEIWIHTDPSHPSNEDDIIRLQDDFGRGVN